MQLTKHIGCLLALVFATATAFAADWFSSSYGKVNEGGSWSVTPGWTAAGTFVEISDWTAGVTFTATDGKTVADDANGVDSKISTTVKFTAINGEGYAMTGDDFPQEMKDVLTTSPKAGLTVVENPANTFTYWGLVNGVWTALTGTPNMADAVTVSVSFYKNDSDAATVEYRVGENVLGTGAMPSPATPVRSIQYLGKCELYDDLKGLVWSNVPSKPDEIAIADGKTIKFNHQELKAFYGVDPDSDASIKTFFETTSDKNGLKGWVNYAIGNVEESAVGVVSNKCEAGKVALDFGFAVAEGHTVGYVINSNETEVTTADIALDSQKNNTKIHTVDVIVDDEVIATETVGVMETGKQLTEEQKTAIGDKMTYDIIAAPWDGYGDRALTVDSLLNTAELTVGDKLYVRKTSGGYDEYTLNVKGGTWTKAAAENTLKSRSNQVAGNDDAGETIEPGSAVWIEHSVDSRLILVGDAGDSSVAPTKTAPAKSEGFDGWTLMANPSIKPLAISDIQGNEGDQIVIEDAADPRQYERKDGAWGKYVKTTTQMKIPGTSITVPSTKLTFKAVDVADVIGAGIGFWYVNTGSAVTITFPSNE